MKSQATAAHSARWVALLSTLGLGLSAFVPLAQPPRYHDFADARSFVGIPNALNVLSNLPFVLIGLAGIFAARSTPAHRCESPIERRAFVLSFAALIAIACGSAYYHWAPDNDRLLWDRLGIALFLATFLGITVIERIGQRTGKPLLFLWPVQAVASTWLWRATGALGPYVLFQVGSILAIIGLLWRRAPRYDRGHDVGFAVLCYGVAKLCEGLDQQTFEWTAHAISGHTLKHLLAATATGFLLRHLSARTLHCT